MHKIYFRLPKKKTRKSKKYKKKQKYAAQTPESMVWKKFMLYFAGNLQRRAIDVGNYILTKSENKMEHINKIELRGNVGTVRLNEYNGSKVANFTVITDFLYKTREGTAANESMWHNVVAWGGKGMPDFDLIVKGATVHLTGRLRINKYTSAEGIEKQYYEVMANKVAIIQEEGK